MAAQEYTSALEDASESGLWLHRNIPALESDLWLHQIACAWLCSRISQKKRINRFFRYTGLLVGVFHFISHLCEPAVFFAGVAI
jgi:hypothetical protein